MDRTVLIQNYHITATYSIARDFEALGYRVLMPDSNWNGRIKYYFDNSSVNYELISFEEYMKLLPGDLLIACIEQQDDMEAIAREHGDRIIIHSGQNNDKYRADFQYLLASDIQLYQHYQCPDKMLYFFKPTVESLTKDYSKCWADKKIRTYIHFYEKWFPEGFKEALNFNGNYGNQIEFYGDESRLGTKNPKEIHKLMADSLFTLYLKEKEAYGMMAIESMLLGTPLIALNRFIEDKTIGQFFIHEGNSITGDTVEELLEKVRRLSYDDYVALCKCAKQTAEVLTDDKARQYRLNLLLRS